MPAIGKFYPRQKWGLDRSILIIDAKLRFVPHETTGQISQEGIQYV